jgi:hypothetical protein
VKLLFDSDNGILHIHDVFSNTVSVNGKTNILVSSIPTGGSIVDEVT